MIGRVYLNGRPDLCSRADAHRHHVENHAIEIQKDVGSQRDVVAIVAMERRRMTAPLPTAARRSRSNSRRSSASGAEGRVVAHHPGLCRLLIRLNLRIVGVIELAGQHLLFLSLFHGAW
jgi:hypothetical protein